MRIEGTCTIDASVERVWDLLLDPAVLARAIPGCDKFEPTGAEEFAAVLKIGVASVKGTYTGRVKIVETEPPRRIKLLVEGSGAPGFVRGEGTLSLEPDGRQTILKVEGDAQVGGTIASVGQRMLGGVAKLLLNQFLSGLQKQALGPVPS